MILDTARRVPEAIWGILTTVSWPMAFAFFIAPGLLFGLQEPNPVHGMLLYGGVELAFVLLLAVVFWATGL